MFSEFRLAGRGTAKANVSASRTSDKFAAMLRSLLSGFNGRLRSAQRQMAIEERLMLGGKKSLLLIACREQKFLIAVSGEGVTPLFEVRSGEGLRTASPETANSEIATLEVANSEFANIVAAFSGDACAESRL